MQTTLTFLGLMSMCFGNALGHGNDSHFSNRQDVTVRTTKVNGNVYMLQGRGGNVGAIVGIDGILIVDDDYKQVSEKLSAALKELGSAYPKYIFNTHWHGDHTQGNEFFGAQSIIVAHTNVRRRMSAPQVIEFLKMTIPASPQVAWPVVTYTESMSVHINGDEVRGVHFPNGHTDGDTVVFFTKANVVHLGDDFFAGKFPFVDLENGGSVQGLISNVAALIRQIPTDAKIIPGHGPVSTIEDLKTYHQTIVDTSNLVQAEMKKGKSVDDVKKGGLPEKYKDWGTGFIKTDMWIETLYRSYSKR